MNNLALSSGSPNFDKQPDFDISYRDITVQDNMQSIMHYHDGYEIMLGIKADVDCFIKDIDYNFLDNSLIFIRPYEIHTLKYKPDFRYIRYVINFSDKLVHEAIRALKMEASLAVLENMKIKLLALTPKNYSNIFTLFCSLYKYKTDGYCEGDDLQKSIIKGYLCVLLMEIYLASTKTSIRLNLNKSLQLVHDIIKFIDASYMDEINLQTIVDKFYINRYYVCHLFKKTTGSSIIEYIQCRRVIEAQKMLLKSDMSINDACFQCGFNNLQHFFRVFKQVSNCTPGQYRVPSELHLSKRNQ